MTCGQRSCVCVRLDLRLSSLDLHIIESINIDIWISVVPVTFATQNGRMDTQGYTGSHNKTSSLIK